MYKRLFLLITIASFSFIQSYAFHESSENVTITVLDEKGNVIVIRNETQIELQIQDFYTVYDTVIPNLDEILKDYKHKEIIKRHILNFISEGEHTIALEPEPIAEPFPDPEPEPILPEPIDERDIGFDIESAKRMGIFDTGCAWHLSPLFENLLTLNKEKLERIIFPFADCTENYYDNKAQDDAIIQIIKTSSQKSEELTLFLFYISIPIAIAIAIGVPILFKQKIVEFFRIQ